ncbi:MAG: 2-oxo acid dehydrogenase subunit E2, partial [Caldilineaceae bacterium]|nr:2-oxo acid dehydrogenase subunit E2 [Caldilineaceae bacterium]
TAAPEAAEKPAEKPAAQPTPSKPATAKPAARAADDFQTGMRRAIALAMAKSNREIPHYYLEQRIDMRTALRWLEAENQQRSIKERVLPVVLLLKATAKALAKVPQLNGFWLDDRLQVSEAIHIGFAIALRQGGLITPAIHHTDLLDMDELMAAVRDLIMRTRAGRLRGSEMTDATIVLTSLGDMGVDKVYGVIYPPQVALVGFGKIMDEVWVQDGLIGVRPVVHATLAGDHRASDGRTGAEFLDLLDKLLQEPAALWR